MIDVNTALQNILKAIYGKQVRESIHDAIYQINENSLESLELAKWKFGNAVTAPTSPVTGFPEGTIYYNTTTGIMWNLVGGVWQRIGTIKTIKDIEKTATSGNVDTYTINFSDGTNTTYEVTNGDQGVSISNVTKTGTTGNVDHYEINLSDGTTTPNGLDIENGLSIVDIEAGTVVGNTKNYKVKLSDNTYTPNGFAVTDGVSSYVHIRYSASFDGAGMVTVPTDSTVYIGICVTSQTNAPTDPSVYNWVRFIGKSGTGAGDMLKSEYATQYAGVVDKAVALFDGTKEISGAQIMSKADFASKGIAGTVDKATELVDTVNNKTADSAVLAKLSESGGKLQYNNKTIDVDIDNSTIVKNASDQLKVADAITTKLSKINSDGTINYSNVASKPTTLSGYGITNAYTKTETDNKLDSVKGTSTVGSDGKTVSFSNIDTSKCYKLFVDMGTSFTDAKPIGIESITLNGTTLTYVLTNASAGMSCKLKEIKL